MRDHLLIAALAFAFLAFSQPAFSQLDEVREITGLPIAIGQPVIYGQVVIENMPRGERRPTIFVALVVGGTQVERRQANTGGYYFFMQRHRAGAAIVVEVNGAEVGRAFLTPTGGVQVRQDVYLDGRSIYGAAPQKGGTVISAKDQYQRTPDNEAAFDKAMAAVRAGKNDEALGAFNGIVAADPKDHFAWTMVGTLQMTDKKYDDAASSFQKALALKPEFTLALINYGRMEINRKEYEKAVELLSKAVAAEETSADANHYLGEAHLLNRKGSLAVGYLNRAIELAPVEKAELHLRLAALYNGAGVKDRAAAEYKMFLEKVKDHPDRKKFEQYIKENGEKK